MSRLQSYAVDLALRLVARGYTISAAARRHGLAVTTVRRAMRRAGCVPLPAGRPLGAKNFR